MTKKAEAAGVPVKLHKLIYRFLDDLDDIVHDVKLKEKEIRGEDTDKEIIGMASILEKFTVTNKKSKSKEIIFGSRILEGELATKYKYQVLRNEEILCDDISL